MNIAVIGAGYAGLSVAWHLLQVSSVRLSVFDSKGIGGGASGISTGLLHPYSSKGTKLPRADEAIKESFQLIDRVEKTLGRSVARHSGILRVDPELWIPEGKTVFSKLYLEGLWRACEERGAQFFDQKILDLEELKEFDSVVLASGPGVLECKECKMLPLKTRKGQALICRWPASLPRLSHSLIGKGHLSLMENPDLCQLGSTYEDEFNPSAALALREKIGLFYPPAATFEIVEVCQGIRVSPREGSLPLAVRINPKTWVFTGLASRGLLYHALYGRELAEQILLQLSVRL
jgi:glycine/D-amino acid oxidase-like deaminating enzyme